MNHFRTIINPGVSTHTLGISSQILTIGSCFADSIGSRLSGLKIGTLANPFGTLYNPVSIHKVLEDALNSNPLPAHTYLQHEDVHLNFNFHSELSALHRHDLEMQLQEKTAAVRDFLKNTDCLMLTYGTARVYTRVDTDEIVANCHKQPAGLFRKSLLSLPEITASFTQLLQAIRTVRPSIRIILTLSPVRHLKDTLVLNNVSKSILRVACHALQEQHEEVEYFPAFEIMTDDLRDYRFYKSDMLHPNHDAEEYIWQNFKARYFDISMHDFAEKWTSIQRALAHRPFHPASSAHQKFLRDTLRRLEELKTFVDVEAEIKTVQAQLIP
jgi:hypothetical protein